MKLSDAISMMFSRCQRELDGWTLDKLIDWVRANEPAEYEVGTSVVEVMMQEVTV